MRNPSAYFPNFLNFQICCIFSKFKNFICAKIFDFKFSHRRESTRRGGGANFTGVAAFGGGVHPCHIWPTLGPIMPNRLNTSKTYILGAQFTASGLLKLLSGLDKKWLSYEQKNICPYLVISTKFDRIQPINWLNINIFGLTNIIRKVSLNCIFSAIYTQYLLKNCLHSKA